MGGSANGGTSIAGWFSSFIENPIGLDDLGIPPISGKRHVRVYNLEDKHVSDPFNSRQCQFDWSLFAATLLRNWDNWGKRLWLEFSPTDVGSF